MFTEAAGPGDMTANLTSRNLVPFGLCVCVFTGREIFLLSDSREFFFFLDESETFTENEESDRDVGGWEWGNSPDG